MAVLSILRRGTGSPALRLLHQAVAKGTFSQNVKSAIVPIRQMGSHRTMQVKPSRYQWEQFKDHVHFYFLLGAVPLGALILSVNIFIGQGELTDIPEGYRPHYWEYYKHPISRWFARNVYNDPEVLYESNLHHYYVDSQKQKYRDLERKVREHMRKTNDYKGWYYVPSDEQKIYIERHLNKEMDAAFGGSS